MSDRAFFVPSALTAVAVAVAVIFIGAGMTRDARAQESPSPPAVDLTDARRPTTRVAAAPKTPPEAKRAPAAATTTTATTTTAAADPYRCHPYEDLACTVVRETVHGLVIATVRSAPEEASSWTIVSAAPPGTFAAPGGTVYIVPTATRTAAVSSPRPPNGAPIID
jgi:hypothetical protein